MNEGRGGKKMRYEVRTVTVPEGDVVDLPEDARIISCDSTLAHCSAGNYKVFKIVYLDKIERRKKG